MFRVVTPESIELPVRVEPPGGGKAQITIRVRYRGVEERVAYLRRITDEQLLDETIIAESLVGWTGLANEDGSPIPFEDKAARDATLDHHYIYWPLRDAIIGELMGRGAAAKN